MRKTRTNKDLFIDWFETNLQLDLEKKPIIENPPLQTRKIFNTTRYAAYKDVCENSTVICTTMTTSSISLLDDFSPRVIIVDEASQCTESDIIGAFNRGASKAILFGD